MTKKLHNTMSIFASGYVTLKKAKSTYGRAGLSQPDRNDQKKRIINNNNNYNQHKILEKKRFSQTFLAVSSMY